MVAEKPVIDVHMKLVVLLDLAGPCHPFHSFDCSIILPSEGGVLNWPLSNGSLESN